MDTILSLPDGIRLAAPLKPRDGDLLPEAALVFLADLARTFGPRVETLLQARKARQEAFDAGLRPYFLENTTHVREGDWTVAPIPADLRDRRVEITGPADPKTLVNGLKSGASGFMADFEDSLSPTWENLLAGQRALRDAARDRLSFEDRGSGRRYVLEGERAVLHVRPRGLHLKEAHLEVDGKPVPASLFDAGLFAFHSARDLAARGTGPYLYLPKLEHFLEARLWNDALLRMEAALDLAPGTFKVTVLVETLPAAFQMDEILFELRERIVGLNAGRWDYLFSLVKTLGRHGAYLLPDRSQVGMIQPFMRAYAGLVVKTAHRRGALAIGGMSAYIPVKDDAEANEEAFRQVRADKEREAGDGFDGTWVAHPALVPVAKAVFDAALEGPNQAHRLREDLEVHAEDLLQPPLGSRTARELNHNLKVAVRYVEAWLRGKGCVPLYNLMEDAATAEIARAQVWQWLHHGVELEGGHGMSRALFHRATLDALAQIQAEVGQAAFEGGRFQEAAELVEDLVLAPDLAPFLTLPAYGRLLRAEAETVATENLVEAV